MYAVVIAPCILCGQPFSFNPRKVPAIRNPATGKKEPICRTCHDIANDERVKRGMEPWPNPLPDAYDPFHESEL